MADSFSAAVSLLATRIGTECKSLADKIGTLTDLSTTTQSDLVAALNEVVSSVSTNTTDLASLSSSLTTLQATVNSIDTSAVIDDTVTATSTTWSSSKINTEIEDAVTEVKDDLLGGAGEAYDTLQELATLITENQDAITALEAIAAGHVKYSEAQDLTTTQQAQARSNIDALGTTETAAAATADASGNTITSTYITSIAASGTTVTYTYGDGSTGTFETQDTDTNTDTMVTQVASTTAGEYPLLSTYTASLTANTTGSARFDADVTLNPGSGAITATTFIGDLSGNATTATSATSATNDGDGNEITSTYATASDLSSLTSSVGDCAADFVTDFETALAGTTE